MDYSKNKNKIATVDNKLNEEIKRRLRIEEDLKKVFESYNKIFFSYAWRDKINEFLTAESKYSRLVEWINERIDLEFGIINVFNPADKDECFTNALMKDYLDACKNVALLVNAKTIILDKNCSTKMRENWEYTLCKLFNIKYNSELGYIDKRSK